MCDFAELVAQALANADAREMLAASRARIVEAGDAERRRLERNLHDGAQQRLVTLALQLRLIRAASSATPRRRPRARRGERRAARALDELRELARGIHPAVLTDRGLEPAVAALADRSSVPSTWSRPPTAPPLPRRGRRVLHHRRGDHERRQVRPRDARRRQRAPRGPTGRSSRSPTTGSVAPTRPAGTGLRGIADRIEALDGRLRITSPLGRGTRLRAEIPTAN